MMQELIENSLGKILNSCSEEILMLNLSLIIDHLNMNFLDKSDGNNTKYSSENSSIDPTLDLSFKKGETTLREHVHEEINKSVY